MAIQPSSRTTHGGPATPDLAPVFRVYADQWYEETAGMSSLTRRIAHPAYHYVMAMGPDVLPLLLQELQENPDYWFWALHCITRQNPVRAGADFDETVQDWLTWGKARHLID